MTAACAGEPFNDCVERPTTHDRVIVPRYRAPPWLLEETCGIDEERGFGARKPFLLPEFPITPPRSMRASPRQAR